MGNPLGKSETEIRQTIIDTTKAFAEHLYSVMEPGAPVEHKAADFIEVTGLTLSVVDDRAVELQGLGILTRTIHFGKRLDDGSWKTGRWAEWELHVSYAEAMRLLDEWAVKVHAGEARTAATKRKAVYKGTKKAKKEKVAQQEALVMKPVTSNAPGTIPTYTSSTLTNVTPTYSNTSTATTSTVDVVYTNSATEDTKAIAGPDAPKPLASLASLRKDEPGALIEAARQYSKRDTEIRSRIQALSESAKALGIEVNEDAVMLGIKMPEDERLATIGLVLPVIDRQEKTIERLTSTVEELRARAKKAEDLDNENRRLRGKVERLISERVTAQQHVQ